MFLQLDITQLFFFWVISIKLFTIGSATECSPTLSRVGPPTFRTRVKEKIETCVDSEYTVPSFGSDIHKLTIPCILHRPTSEVLSRHLDVVSLGRRFPVHRIGLDLLPKSTMSVRVSRSLSAPPYLGRTLVGYSGDLGLK